MQTKYILIVSGNSYFSGRYWKEFEASFAQTDEEAIEIANRQAFDMAIIDSTSSQVNSKKLAAVLPLLQEEIEIVWYEGETLNDLKNKVSAVFAQQKRERMEQYLVLDGEAMNAHFNLLPFSAN
jgi:hypothetical protein